MASPGHISFSQSSLVDYGGTICSNCGVRSTPGMRGGWVSSWHHIAADAAQERGIWGPTVGIRRNTLAMCPSMALSNVVKALFKALPRYSHCTMPFDVWGFSNFWAGVQPLGPPRCSAVAAPKCARACGFLLYYCSWVSPSRFCGGGSCSGALTTTLGEGDMVSMLVHFVGTVVVPGGSDYGQYCDV